MRGARTLVAGVDSSTQSTKVVVCDAETGEVLREGRAPHPDGTEVDPRLWWAAYQQASAGLLDGVAAIGVAGQQQGMVCLDEAGEVLRPAILWNDTRSARAAVDLTAEFGGPKAWADAVGLVPVASFTVTKLRWFSRAEPELADRTATVLLPHDWLTHRLRADGGEPTTDRGEASGTGYWSPAAGAYRRDLVRLAFGRDVALPRVAGPAEVVGETASGALLSAGTGDTMGGALGVGLRPGDVLVSLGTSGCVYGLSDGPTADASGLVAGYADATGRFLPLVCTLNAARVLVAVADLLGRSLAELDDLALSARPGAGGLTLLPYLDGERTPNLPDARGLLAGLTRANASAANLARAAVEGMLGGIADALHALRAQDVPVARVLLIGGAARSRAVRAIAPALFGAPVSVPRPAEYVALGAARQAAWALSGDAEPPPWPVEAEEITAAGTPGVYERYVDVRQQALPLLT
ncbi:xylulokinase [Micromonospora sp. HM134]|uniref:xylulokinase n=1 Tax=unclassified Micromonospora TaxID=2617518 RepID=UPI0011985591|nr:MULTISPECIES: xylulokinase [unclassified Micromonospora]QDY07809.1 xylulokinase [Micromonospora sp. HM134]